MRRLLFVCATLALGAAIGSRPGRQGRSAIAAYQKASGVSGNLNSVGSDTMNNLMTLWAEAFRKMYPNVKIQIEGKGSSHGAAGADRRHGAVRPDVARR